jgi:hypothetical protein
MYFSTMNPLEPYFRKPQVYISLPSQGRWYKPQDITLTGDNELAIYGMTARDDVLLNTPDAMLNGEALKKVIANCVPDVHNINALVTPDLEAIFVAMKLASGDGTIEINRDCPKCGHDCSWDLQCQPILDRQTLIEHQDGVVVVDQSLEIHVKPYDYKQRSIFIQQEYQEERAIRQWDTLNPDSSDLLKAEVMAQAIDNISQITIKLVSASITHVKILHSGEVVSDPDFIIEWLRSAPRAQAEAIISAVDQLNKCGPNKNIDVECPSCANTWQVTISYDPISFFVKRS